MEGHEQVHLDRFNALLNEHQVRPTAMIPLWKVAATVLGAGTALISDKAAHACTEAVESVIEKHYAEQIAEIKDRDPELAARLVRSGRGLAGRFPVDAMAEAYDALLRELLEDGRPRSSR